MHVAVWSGTSWSATVCGGTTEFLGAVHAAAVVGDSLYVALDAGSEGQIIRLKLP